MPPELRFLTAIARDAGDIAMRYFRTDNEVWYKNGTSPVSLADRDVNRFLFEKITRQFPEYGWLSEESEDDHERLNRETVVIVDPIDGTRGFIAGKSEWCISIAIVKDKRPNHAVLHCPALNQTFAASRGSGLILSNIEMGQSAHTRKPLVTGSSKLIDVINDLPGKPFATYQFIPSLAYRMALVAIGKLDGAFARPGASEWDVAAADLILEEGGGKLSDKQDNVIRYNRPKLHLPSLIAGTKAQHSTILSLANSHGILH